MEDGSKPLTAFSTPSGLFQFRTMQFGLVNAPATFSRLIGKLLHGMTGVENFLNDIILFSDTWEEHLKTFMGLLSRLRNAGLTARPYKCFISYDQLDCLGHIVGAQRLQPELSKIEAVQNALIPTT